MSQWIATQREDSKGLQGIVVLLQLLCRTIELSISVSNDFLGETAYMRLLGECSLRSVSQEVSIDSLHFTSFERPSRREGFFKVGHC